MRGLELCAKEIGDVLKKTLQTRGSATYVMVERCVKEEMFEPENEEEELQVRYI